MDLFTIRVLISFLVGGLFIGLLTLVAERVPLKWRGVVLAMPSTIALAFFFIGLTKGVDAIPHIAVVTVAGVFICTYIFGAAFSFFSRYSLSMALFFGFIFCILSAIPLILFPPNSMLKAVLVGMPILLISYFIVSNLPQVSEINPVPFTTKHVLIRSLFAGIIIAVTVILAKTFGNVWGGVFAAFPVAFSTTLVIYYKAHGKEIIPSVAKSLFFPGSLVLSLYSLTASLTFPKFGIWIGTLFSYVICIFFIILYKKFQDTIT